MSSHLDSLKKAFIHFMKLELLVSSPFTDEKNRYWQDQWFAHWNVTHTQQRRIEIHSFLGETWTQVLCPLSFWLHFCANVPVLSTVLAHIIKICISFACFCLYIYFLSMKLSPGLISKWLLIQRNLKLHYSNIITLLILWAHFFWE